MEYNIEKVGIQILPRAPTGGGGDVLIQGATCGSVSLNLSEKIPEEEKEYGFGNYSFMRKSMARYNLKQTKKAIEEDRKL